MKDRTPATPDPDDLPPLNLGDGDEPGLNESSEDSIQNAQAKPFDYGSAPSESAKMIDAASAKFADTEDEFSKSTAALNASIESLTKAILGAKAPTPPAVDAIAKSAEFRSSVNSATPSAPLQNADADTKSPFVVPGKSTGKDGVNAVLRSGEYVLRPEATAAIGVKTLDRWNSMLHREPHATGGAVGSPPGEPAHFATGGPVTPMVSTAANAPNAIANNATNIANMAAQGFQAGGTQGAAVMASLAALASTTGALEASFGSLKASVDTASARLDSYSGDIASANAKAEQRQTLGDVRRAEYVGKEVGRYTENASKFSQHAQDLEATLMKAGLAVLNPLMELLEPMAQFMLKHAENFISEMLDSMGRLVQFVAVLLEKEIPDFAIELRKVAFEIKNAANKDKDKEGLDINSFMAEFLAGHGMGQQAGMPKFGDVQRNAPPGRRGFRGAMPPLPGRFGLPGMDLGGAGRGM